MAMGVKARCDRKGERPGRPGVRAYRFSSPALLPSNICAHRQIFPVLGFIEGVGVYRRAPAAWG